MEKVIDKLNRLHIYTDIHITTYSDTKKERWYRGCAGDVMSKMTSEELDQTVISERSETYQGARYWEIRAN